MKALFHLLVLSLTTIALTAIPTAAQQSGGKITGTVTDSKDAVLPGARVEVQQNGLVVASAATDGQGQFTVSNLAPGSYAVRISYLGFSPFSTNSTVTAGQTA